MDWTKATVYKCFDISNLRAILVHEWADFCILEPDFSTKSSVAGDKISHLTF